MTPDTPPARPAVAAAGVHLFVGPSAHGVDMDAWRKSGVTIWPPVRRGDVARLVRDSPTPGVLLVCDGVFQGEPAVSHAELCEALDAGWQAWGVSSMGAIRAFELRDQGMHGFGEVYRLFEAHPGYPDDELCLLHFPEAPYFPVTEALVNLRHGLSARGACLGVSPAAARAVLDRLGAMWFGDRTDAQIQGVLVTEGGLSAADAESLMAWVRGNRIKTQDLCRLMTSRPWDHPSDDRA